MLFHVLFSLWCLFFLCWALYWGEEAKQRNDYYLMLVHGVGVFVQSVCLTLNIVKIIELLRQ